MSSKEGKLSLIYYFRFELEPAPELSEGWKAMLPVGGNKKAAQEYEAGVIKSNLARNITKLFRITDLIYGMTRYLCT